MIIEKDFDIAPCLRKGPISNSAQAFVSTTRDLSKTRCASLIKAWSVPFLFDGMEKVFALGQEPSQGINGLLESLAEFMKVATNSRIVELGDTLQERGAEPDVAKVTGEHYGQLFSAFSSPSFWDEPTQLLRTRLERNGINISDLCGKEALDAGCGGGRYTVAWRQLGIKHAVGIDLSETGVLDAQRRVHSAAITGVDFKQASVLNIPFPDNSFDVVFSNGVLHHTTDWKLGVSELIRVLKPGGLGWLYLIEKPGGLFWDVIEILRVMMWGESKATARMALQLLGIPANRIFYMLDHVMVPINLRLTAGEIEACLTEAGAIGVRRLSRGADFDRIEQIFQDRPYVAIQYGIGENRYVFSKV